MSDLLTVVTFKWAGWRGDNFYTPRHVHTLQQMVLNHLRIPHRFVCVTDNPAGLRCMTVPLWPSPPIVVAPKRPNSYVRLKLFAREAVHMFGPRVLQLDLDCVILRDITPLITDEPFKIVEGKAAPYNGSMWLLKTGSRPDVWDDLNKHSADIVRRYAHQIKRQVYGSDQGWMSYKIRNAPTWGAADGVHHYTLINNEVPKGARIVFHAGSKKPWSEGVRLTAPALYDMYRQQQYEAEHGDNRAADTGSRTRAADRHGHRSAVVR